MGKRQRKNSFIYRTSLVILFLISFKSYSQNIYQSIYLQNAFYQEFSLEDEERSVIISEVTVENCDSLTGVIKPYFLEEIKKDTTQKKWKISSIFRFDYQEGEYAFIKIYKMKDSINLGTSLFGFFKNEKCWQKREVKELENIKIAIEYLKSDSFWAFYNSGRSGMKEIDKIKSNYKTANGILNIDKLGAYLQTKPKELAKYCDY